MSVSFSSGSWADTREIAAELLLKRLDHLTGTPRDLTLLDEIASLRLKTQSQILNQRVLEFVAVALLKHKQLDFYRRVAPSVQNHQVFEKHLFMTCAGCQGKGAFPKMCTACRGSGRHSQCNGRGFNQIGGGIGNSRPTRHKCTACNGTGACTYCQGRRTIGAIRCKTCQGERVVPNQQQIDVFYRQTLETLRNELMEPIIMKAVVMIEGDKGMGTGFLCRFSEKTYVISNAHVFIGNDTVNLLTVDGVKLTYNGVYMSKDRDLILYEMGGAEGLAPLELIGGMMDLRIGNRLVVYGNSQGAGVATYLTGVVQAVGPSEFETNASFVSGNSGSPLIVNGKVAGVATYARQFNKNWVSEGTRFTEVRRFATRLDNTSLSDFVAIDLEEYRKQNKILNELKRVNDHIIQLINERRFDQLTDDLRSGLSKGLKESESFQDLGSYMMKDELSQQTQRARNLVIFLGDIEEIREKIRVLVDKARAREREIPGVIKSVLEDQQQGRYGVAHWVRGSVPSRLYAPISWSILDPMVNGIRALVPVVVESSTRGGSPIQKEWTFILVFTDQGWKVEDIRY
jgi:S1-C subfamily serine protease